MEYFDQATYSPEDNKLRLYINQRLPDGIYQTLIQNGFRCAPKQELFVTPAWTPEREDICHAYCEEIEPEQTTVLERAEVKAERLDAIAEKRLAQGNAYSQAAHELSERFASGQPILIGHHSERKARKDQQRMNQASDKAAQAFKSIRYWQWRAEGVERHANRINTDRRHHSRIKRLLKDLRHYQRNIAHTESAADIWQRVGDQVNTDPEQGRDLVCRLIGSRIDSGTLGGSDSYDAVKDGTIDAGEFAVDMAVKWNNYDHTKNIRWINHILNRLAYEQSQLPLVARFTGEIRAPILQTFCRTHGAVKPKAQKTGTGWAVTSETSLPAHISDGKTVTRTEDEWRDLMQSIGYHVDTTPPKRRPTANAPLINPTIEDAERLQGLWNDWRKTGKYAAQVKQWPVVKAVDQKTYSLHSKGDYGQMNTVALDEQGRHTKDKNAAVCRIRVASFPSFYTPDSVVHISDKPAKNLPVQLEA